MVPYHRVRYHRIDDDQSQFALSLVGKWDLDRSLLGQPLFCSLYREVDLDRNLHGQTRVGSKYSIVRWNCRKSRSDQTGLHWSASRTPSCKLYIESQVVHRIISCTPNHKSTQNQYQSLHGTALNHKSHTETQVAHWNTSCTLKHNTVAETVPY